MNIKTINGKVIQSIKSKCLSAYLTADNATYLIANNNYSYSPYATTRYSRELIMQIIAEGDPKADINDEDYNVFFEMLQNKVKNIIDKDNYMSKDRLANILSNTIEEFNSLGEVTNGLQIQSLSYEQILARMNGSEEDENLIFANGLIAFDEPLPEGVSVSIDREKKQMIVEVEGLEPYKTNTENSTGTNNGTNMGTSKDKVIEPVKTTHTYYYNLEGWITKYSRPYELMLALHLATMAPEFAYEIATSPETNAKVIMGFKETKVEMELVIDDSVSSKNNFVVPPNATGSSNIISGSDVLAEAKAEADLKFMDEQFTKQLYELAAAKSKEYATKLVTERAEKAADAYINNLKWADKKNGITRDYEKAREERKQKILNELHDDYNVYGDTLLRESS